MAELASLFLSPILQVLFEKLASTEFRQRKLDDDLLRKLKTTLISINKLREDAEDKQFADSHVKEWLVELKDALYKAQDILDEIATEALQRQLDIKFQTRANKVQNSISTYFSSFVKKLEAKIGKLITNLKDLADQKDTLGLKEGEGRKPSKILPTTSFVDESKIVGRDDAKENLVNLLLLNDASGDENVRVIAIVGTGGIGKTTLAQCVFNDERVKKYFDPQAWVCVSQEFDVLGITKTILEKLTSSTFDTKDLDRLQQKLAEELVRKKFLLVLDDVWNENEAKWEGLSYLFKSGTQGSVVIVTTRKENVISKMRPLTSTFHKYPIDMLSDKDCWSLFTKHAFHNNNLETHLEFENIGRQIVKKCKGLPLAIKTIGGMLQSKLNVDEWEKILESSLWDLSDSQEKILPALSLSYRDLTIELKACFAYCSIFPEDYTFSRDEVISLWMAEGLLKGNKNQTMEEVGRDYFDVLRSRSLLETSKDKVNPGFVMHDLVHNLAESVSKQFIVALKVDTRHEIPNMTRHMSLWAKDVVNVKKLESLPRQLHTFLPSSMLGYHGLIYISNRVLHDLLSKLRYLRVLSLQNHHNLTELPESIDEIKYLRYLDLSHTGIKMLPNSICKLCNLQTLNLSYSKLVELPKDMQRLVNLCHLDISGTNIKEMPRYLGELKNLQTLTNFVVSKHDRADIQELRKISNLKGKFSISELQNVESPIDPLQQYLKDKKYLEDLEFTWSNPDSSDCQRDVLQNLYPHSNLKSLTVKKYGAESFPDWVGCPSFSSLTSLHLNDCKNCCNLPPLGQLCSLQNLYLHGLSGVVKLGREFYGNNSSSIKPFGALKLLRFSEMLNWEEWSFIYVENDGGNFPQLQELSISDCPKLTGQLPNYLPSLAELTICRCSQLVVALPRAPAMRDLCITDCSNVLPTELPIGLLSLVISESDALKCLPKVMVNCSSGIQGLTIQNCLQLELPTNLDFSSFTSLRLDNCGSVKSLPLYLFPKLNYVYISSCMDLESSTISEQHGHDLLANSLHIRHCPSLVSFPRLRAPKLTSLRIDSCQSLRSFPDNMRDLLPCLVSFSIWNCPEVASFSRGGFPSSLTTIDVRGCRKLFAKRKEWGLENHPSIQRMSISGRSEDVKSFPEPRLLPSSLLYLDLWNFENMEMLDAIGLQHLTSLKRLSLFNCPTLAHIPKKGLPASLYVIDIYKCPLLKKQWQSKKGKKQRNIPDVDRITIDGEYIRIDGEYVR